MDTGISPSWRSTGQLWTESSGVARSLGALVRPGQCARLGVMALRRWLLCVGVGVGCTPERVPPPGFGPEVFGVASEVSQVEVGDTARYEVRFIGTGERGDQHAVMGMRVSEVEAPIDTEVAAAVDCDPHNGDLGWVWNPQSAVQDLAHFEVEAAPVPFDIRCTIDLVVPSAPQRAGDDPVVVNVAWEATLELVVDGRFEGDLNARVDIDSID